MLVVRGLASAPRAKDGLNPQTATAASNPTAHRPKYDFDMTEHLPRTNRTSTAGAVFRGNPSDPKKLPSFPK